MLGIVIITLLLLTALLPVAYEIWRNKRAGKRADEALLRRDEELHDPWQSTVGINVPKPTPTKPSEKSPKIALSVKQRDNLNCPLCLDKMATDVIMCTKCNTILHYDCVEELNNGCCPVLGCKTYLRSEKRLQIVKRTKV